MANNQNSVTTSNHSDKSDANLFKLILCCFFISGMTGLTYEILWTRMIVKIIGSAPFAVSIVLTVFMGGLGLGSFLAGRMIDRVQEPLKLVRLYGFLEIGIGVYGLVLPLLLVLFKPIYAVLYNHLFQYFFLYNLLTFAGCAVLLIIPVTFMGATLPVLSRFFVTSLSQLGTHVGRLYGLNTIGAAFGSLLCGFWLINYLGVWGSLLFAIVLNASIGFLCLFLSRHWSPRPHDGQRKDQYDFPPSSSDPMESPTTGSRDPVWHALMIFAISGFCAMAYEVIWVKLLSLIVGPTTYSLTVVLVTFITGLALGSIFFGWLVDRMKNPTFLLLSTQLAAGIFALVISQIIGDSQIFFSLLIQKFQDSFIQLMTVQFLVLFAFMFFPTFCLGATFPLVGKIYTRSLRKTGRSIGYAYAVNTIGAVLGSFCAGFILIPFLGKEISIRCVVGFQTVSALIIWAILIFRQGKSRLALLPCAVLAGYVVAISLFPYPHWNRLMLSKGKYHRFEQMEQRHLGWVEALFSGMDIYSKDQKQELAYYGDGIGGFTSVLKSTPDIFGQVHYSLLNSGKADASSQRGDMGTQTLLAHFPMLVHPKPENVLVLGLASGITAGEVLHYPINRLDVVEINYQVIEASHFFRPWNNEVLSDPRTELIVQDGRAHLELTDRRYDVIISEPSNPWMAGLAALFTKEFMELAKNKLNDRGIFVQWIHSYQMNWETFAMVGRTFSQVFPNGVLVCTNPLSVLYGPDFLLIGIKGDRPLDFDAAVKNLRYSQQSKNINLLNADLLYNLVTSENLTKLFGAGRINSDPHPWLEFSAPKLLHYTKSAEEIAKKIQSNTWLSESTVARIKNNRTDMDRQIDFEAFRFAFNLHGKTILDLSQASSSQKDRYIRLLETYCTEAPIYDFTFVNDPQIKLKCIAANLGRIERKAAESPDKASEYYYMGWVCNNNGLPYEAAKYFFKALHYSPGDAKANDALQKIVAQKDANLLYPLFQEELQTQPQNPAIQYHAGNLLRRFGQIEAARAHYEAAFSLDTSFILPLNQLADIALSKAEYDKAIAIYKRMVQIKPAQATFYYNIACLYCRQNQSQEALKWLQTAVDKGYDNWQLLKTDKDLELIRNTQEFQQIIAQSNPT